jgi:ribosomal protein L37AE/L43A
MKLCNRCGEPVSSRRYALGYKVCMPCGDSISKQVKHTIVPMPKSNYIVVTDHSLLIGLNNSHKGGAK